MIPQPKPSRLAPYTPPKGGSKGKGKGKKGKGEHGGKSDPSKPAVDIPDGCSAKEPTSGKPFVSLLTVMDVSSPTHTHTCAFRHVLV